VALRRARRGWEGLGGARRGLKCYSVFANNVSVFAENIFVGLRWVKRG
jgi:hypothetical protein